MHRRFAARIDSPGFENRRGTAGTADILRYLGAAAGVVLAAVIAGAPLPFASVGRGAETALQVAAFLAFALAVGGAPKLRALGPAAAPALALAGVALCGLAQAGRLPAAAVGVLSPERLRLERQAAAALAPGGERERGAPSRASGDEAGQATPPRVSVGEPGRTALSLAPRASRAAALGWVALAACLAAAALVGADRVRRRWLAVALGAAALFEVLFATRHLLAGSPTIWGVPVPSGGPRLRGTFVNPNHFATYLEIALAAAFAWGWWSWRRMREAPSAERRLLLAAPPAILWLTLFAALALTRSRAGLAAALAAVVLQGLLLAAAQRRLRLAPVGLVLGLVGVGAVAAAGLQQGLGRLLGTSAYEVTWGARAELYRAALGLWRDFPLAGTGLGTFAEAFPMVQPPGLVGTYLHAHNDWLELLVTTGVVGAALVVWGLWRLLARLSRVLLGGHRSEDRAAALAALGALASLAIHEGLDFGLTTPANAFTLAIVCGAAAGARSEGGP
jgi:O-antigen ligase